MSVLYRRYRPTTFAELYGQDHIRVSLQNSLRKDLIGHAYLFSGSRGSGKTTVARLFAKAVNCQKPTKDFEPCNSCSQCTEIITGQTVDVIEIDAASNRGIDEIRELRERVAFTPVKAKYKVYIIDEVHMLTKEAFNALLKTLEEPPAHVIFILATTELHKVPETIISRCQRYQFHRATIEQTTELLNVVAKKENIKLGKGSAELIAVRADGSYRDALTLLGNVATHEGIVEEQDVRLLLGLPTEQIINELETAITQGETEKLIELLRRSEKEGIDLVVLVRQLAEGLKNRILTTDFEKAVANQAGLLEQLLYTLGRSRHSSDPVAALVARLVMLSRKNAPTTPQRPVIEAAEPNKLTDLQKTERVVEETPTVDSVSPLEAKPAVSGSAAEFWSNFVSQIKVRNHALYAVLRSAQPEEITDEKIVIAVQFKFYADRLKEVKNRQLIEEAITKVAGKPLLIEINVKSTLDISLKTNDDMVQNVVEVFELEEVNS